MFYRLAILTLLSFTSALASAQAPRPEFGLASQELMHTDNTLVLQLSLVMPRTDANLMTKLHMRWPLKYDLTARNGVHGKDDSARKAQILIVAQVAAGTSEHPPMLLISIRQRSGGAALNFLPIKLDSDMTLDQALSIDVKPGRYPLDRDLQIGQLGGKPIVLAVEHDTPK